MTDYYDLGTYSRPVSTESPDAQRWFDRGLVWCYGFNHWEALRCFQNVTRLDPGCAMGYWGLAYAVGPDCHKPWEAYSDTELYRSLENADTTTQTAIELADCATAVERAIISALPHRYPSETPADDFTVWNDDYANTMRDVYEAFPDDLDVVALCAEALMARSDWNLWDPDGVPLEGADTMEVDTILERALDQMKQPGAAPHPGVLHMYIRLMEKAAYPQHATEASELLLELVPDPKWQAGVPRDQLK